MGVKLTPAARIDGRFVVFGFSQYYPGGGLSDIFGSGDTLEKAEAIIEASVDEQDFWEILDRETGETWSMET